MDNKLKIFENEEFGKIRTLNEEGKILFCGSDVARSLGYSNPKKAINDHCKKDGVTICSLTDVYGRLQQAKFISEGNLYRLIAHSKLPSAEKFESWVFDEVLPSLRKNGTYEIPRTPMETLKLMFEVEKENADKIDKLEVKVSELDENAMLNQGEYSYIQKMITDRINFIKQQYSLTEATKLCTKELYRAINHDIKQLTGVYTRSQLRRKHFEKVIELIKIWTPSQVLNMKLKEMLETGV